MRLFKCQGGSDIFWPLDGNDANVAGNNSDLEPAECSADVVLDLGSSQKLVR